jgi:hypothetical protein
MPVPSPAVGDVVDYYVSTGTSVPAVVEATNGASPPVLALFVLDLSRGYRHVTSVQFSETGDENTWVDRADGGGGGITEDYLITVDNPSVSVGAADETVYKSIDGQAWVSEGGAPYRPVFLGFVVDVGAKYSLLADGTTNEAAKVQQAYDFAYTEISAGRLPFLQWPQGDIAIASTIVVKGNSSAAPVSIGATPFGAPAFNTPRTRFKWTGADNTTMFYCESFNKGMFQGIDFFGNDKAGCGVHFAASTYADPAILAASSGWGMENCAVKNFKPGVAGNACVKIGTDPALTGGLTFQSSEGVFRRCDFVGESTGAAGFSWAGLAVAGIKTMSGGNCKNFAAYDCTFNVCETAIDWTAASGNFVVTNMNGANVQTVFRQSDGHLVVIGGDVESGNVVDFYVLRGTGGGGNTYADIRGLEALGTKPGADQYLMDWAGQLHLYGNLFSASLAGGAYVPFRLKAGGGTTWNNITSEANWYGEATDYAPFYDGSGNQLAPIPGVYGGENALNVRSWGDLGGPISSNPVPLENFDLSGVKFFRGEFSSPNVYRGVAGIGARGGGGQALATALVGEVNFVNNVPAPGDSVKLPTAELGKRVVVYNETANAVDIFPVTGGSIDALGVNTAYSLAGGASREFWAKSATVWLSK